MSHSGAAQGGGRRRDRVPRILAPSIRRLATNRNRQVIGDLDDGKQAGTSRRECERFEPPTLVAPGFFVEKRIVRRGREIIRRSIDDDS